MKFINTGADAYIPDGSNLETALKRTNGGCVGIGAHQDDLEIFAMHGIGQCYGRTERMFTGITVSNGAGSVRKGNYAALSDEQMVAKRHEEQQKAAAAGKYSAQFQLHYNSRDIKGANPLKGAALAEEIHQILLLARPETVYAHNPFDKHETHVAVLRATLQALRKLPPGQQPKHFYGCEVWRGLDWLPETLKVYLDVSPYKDLQEKLINCHDSQIAGSKNYTQATLGRELANATYADSYAFDTAEAVTYAIDLMPFLKQPQLTLEEFTQRCTDAFADQILSSARTYVL